MKAKLTFLLGALLLVTLSLFTPSVSHAQATTTDQYGVVYSAVDGVAIATPDKRDQLFRVINIVRSENSLPQLVYQTEDQSIADLRVRELARNFVADTLTCRGEVIFKGTFGEITALATNYLNARNLQYYPEIETASIGLMRKQDVYYAVIRIF